MSERAGKKNLSLQVQWDAETPRHVHTDGTKLRQVLINLVGNAIKFTAEGGVLLDVAQLGDSPEGRCRLRFAVSDTGPGIAAEERERLFQAFSQTQSGLRSQEGTGLGLAISRQYVQLLGGDISVESEPGRGSRFAFELSLERLSDNAPAYAAERQVIGVAPGQPRHRLLVVDDIEVNRQLLLQILEPLGFEVDVVANGEDALAHWQARRPDLILLDIRMPGIDGYEVARRIRVAEPDCRTKLLALTASAFADERERVLAAGCDDFLRKPLRESELLEALARHLNLVFDYGAEVGDKAPSPNMCSKTMVAALRAAPPDWLRQLHDAAIMGQLEGVIEVIESYRGRDPVLASKLSRLAEDFEHGRIVELVERALDAPSNRAPLTDDDEHSIR